jgi:hypothetical protein
MLNLYLTSLLNQLNHITKRRLFVLAMWAYVAIC